MSHQFAPETYNAVKTAWKLLVGLLGGVDAASAAVDRAKSRISEYGTPHTDRFVPVDLVLDAERLAGEPLVTAALARAQGYALLPVQPRATGELAVVLAELGRDVSKLFGDAALALHHSEPTPAEREALARDLDAVACVVTEARMHLMPAATSPGRG